MIIQIKTSFVGVTLDGPSADDSTRAGRLTKLWADHYA